MENEISNKRKKKLPPSQSETMVESINYFPDEILTHILSFLPFKETFRTSILSKRWVPLCHSHSDLDFEDDDLNNANDLIQFRQMLDAVMLSPHAQNLTLNSFHLECRSELWKTEAEYCFDKWIEAALRRCVKDLDISLILLNVPLASTIFCCKTLVALNLTSIRVPTMIHCSVHLPLLKTLTVYFVQFECKEDFMKLLTGCPILENLNTGIVDATTGDTAAGYFKPLSNLINVYTRLFEVPFVVISNAQTLCVMGMGESLANEAINSYYKGFPVFGNLTDLLLNWSDGSHDWDEVLKMLQNCPKLQNLLIYKCTDSTIKEDWKYPDHVPECVSSHLRTCEIRDYQAVEADLRFATYILQNARLLKVMKIFYTGFSNSMESPQFLEDLSSCTRISPTCELLLSEESQ